MVTIKGTEISDQLALDSIKAMEKLIYLYENPKEFITCPLCNLPNRSEGCTCCPWILIENKHCGSSNFFTVTRENPERKRKRKRQLRRWIKIYQKALSIKNI